MKESNPAFSRSIGVWGEERMQALQDATILVAGVGGLGSVVSETLVRAGVGKLILLDDGIIDAPDLNRQILYDLDDLGKVKVDIAAKKLSAVHGASTIIPLRERIEPEGANLSSLKDFSFDGIADCFDNFPSRFALEGLLTQAQFLVHGGVQNDYGQVTTIRKTETKSLAEIFQNMATPENPLPVSPQIVACVGSLMAQEVTQNLWSTPQLLNTLLVVELADFSFFKIHLKTVDDQEKREGA